MGTSENELTRNLSGNIRPQSSQLAEPLWTDPGIESGISVRELTSTKKKKKRRKAQAGNAWSNIIPKSLQARKRSAPHYRRGLVQRGLSHSCWPAREGDDTGLPSLRLSTAITVMLYNYMLLYASHLQTWTGAARPPFTAVGPTGRLRTRDVDRCVSLTPSLSCY